MSPKFIILSPVITHNAKKKVYLVYERAIMSSSESEDEICENVADGLQGFQFEPTRTRQTRSSESSTSNSDSGASAPIPRNELDAAIWCSCGICSVENLSARECVCCLELPKCKKMAVSKGNLVRLCFCRKL